MAVPVTASSASQSEATERQATESRAGAPPSGTLEASAWAYVTTERLEDKLTAPDHRAPLLDPPRAFLLDAPGRPSELEVAERGARTRSLHLPQKRAQLVHTFLHHELQAAELMCWAALRFVDTPEAFRRGLLAIAADEVRHMKMYRAYIRSLGFDIGSFPVRDWFWQRVPSCPTPAHFVATMGMGFEGGNLDHCRRFAARFRDVGDEEGALIQEKVGREEVAHVRFALKWFRAFTGGDDFGDWCDHLPDPLSPAVMRGKTIDGEARGRAGMSEPFLDELATWRMNP